MSVRHFVTIGAGRGAFGKNLTKTVAAAAKLAVFAFGIAVACPPTAGAATEAASAANLPSSWSGPRISRHDQRAYRNFVKVLLRDKNPERAYATMASPGMVQHQPPFGESRETTIRQWLTMTAKPQSHFKPVAIRFEGDIATTLFHGVLDPKGPGAEVTIRDRISNGRIVEEWGEFHPLPAH